MALDTLNNGDSGLDARTKINAAIAAVNGHTTPRVYYVESSGNDGTAVAGDRSKPFLTAQAAFDAFAASAADGVIMLGVGLWAGITITSAYGFPLSIKGCGMYVSSLGGITAFGININLASDRTVNLGSINLSGANGANGADGSGIGGVGGPGSTGSNGGTASLIGCVFYDLILRGGDGGNGGGGGIGDESNVGGNGGDGGTGGTNGLFKLLDCLVLHDISALQGGQGNAGGGGFDGGAGGGSSGMPGSSGEAAGGSWAYRSTVAGTIDFGVSSSATYTTGLVIYNYLGGGNRTEAGGSINAAAVPF